MSRKLNPDALGLLLCGAFLLPFLVWGIVTMLDGRPTIKRAESCAWTEALGCPHRDPARAAKFLRLPSGEWCWYGYGPAPLGLYRACYR